MRRFIWFSLILFALPALAQPRGGPQNSQAVLINNCVATSGACPADGYVCVLAATKVIYQCKVSTGWRQISIGGASNSPSSGQCATWDAVNSTVKWDDCATGSGGGGTLTVTEGSTEIAASTLTFGLGFDVTEPSSGTASVLLDYTEDPVNISGSEVTGTLPIAKGGTGQITAALARSAMELAKSGANSDITSIDGLTTPLAVAQGGTGQSAISVNQVVEGTGTNTTARRTIPSCPAGNQLLHNTTGTCTNGEAAPCFDCEADGASGTGSYKIVKEEGVSLGSDGSGTTLDFVNSSSTNSGVGALVASGTGTTKTITLYQSGSGTKVIDNLYAITAGTGLKDGGTMTSTGITINVDSTEANFLTDGGASSLTCSSSPGKAQVLDNGTLNYCDGSTNTTRYAALGDSSGNAATGDSATGFFSTGTLGVGIGGTGNTTLGTTGQVQFNDGGNLGFDETGSMFSYNKTTDVLTVGAVLTTGATDNNRYIEIQGNTGDVGIPSVGYLRLYAAGTAGSEDVKYYTFTGGIKTVANLTGTQTLANKTLTTPIETGKIDRNNVTVDDDDCTGEQGLYWYDTTDAAFEFCNANSGTPLTVGTGSGTITNVWGTSSGDASAIVGTTGDSLDASAADFVRLPYGTAPTVTSTGGIGVDSSADQIVYNSSSTVFAVPSKWSSCAVLEEVTSADDNYEFWEAPYAVTITDVSCRCRGTGCATTKATFTLEDRGGNAMTITGTNPTCSTTGDSTYAAVTANNTLGAGEGLAFDVTNSPTASNVHTICVKYTVTRQ